MASSSSNTSPINSFNSIQIDIGDESTKCKSDEVLNLSNARTRSALGFKVFEKCFRDKVQVIMKDVEFDDLTKILRDMWSRSETDPDIVQLRESVNFNDQIRSLIMSQLAPSTSPSTASHEKRTKKRRRSDDTDDNPEMQIISNPNINWRSSTGQAYMDSLLSKLEKELESDAMCSSNAQFFYGRIVQIMFEMTGKLFQSRVLSRHMFSGLAPVSVASQPLVLRN